MYQVDIHMISSFQGQATDIFIQAEEIMKLKKQINQLYVRHTGLDISVIENSIERDNFMNPEEARKFGLIDKVLIKPAREGAGDNAVTES